MHMSINNHPAGSQLWNNADSLFIYSQDVESTLKRRCLIDVDSTSWRWINVVSTFFACWPHARNTDTRTDETKQHYMETEQRQEIRQGLSDMKENAKQYYTKRRNK